jgi:hypothetical protein
LDFFVSRKDAKACGHLDYNYLKYNKFVIPAQAGNEVIADQSITQVLGTKHHYIVTYWSGDGSPPARE